MKNNYNLLICFPSFLGQAREQCHDVKAGEDRTTTSRGFRKEQNSYRKVSRFFVISVI